MKMTIESLSILNFKGIRELNVNFNDETTISGANATGKTNIVDAFMWLLFGKDSADRKVFNIKTIDPLTNRTIERLSHEVSGVLNVDGTTITLKKCYSEIWAKKRGKETEEFTGHEVTQFVNDVPCSAREYQQKIDAICPEQIFKLITNPLYFCEQKKEVQRATLFEMAGNITDNDIARSNNDFADLLNKLSGKTIEEYKREISAKKKKIKDELSSIPSRIDERKRSMPEAEDWTKLEKELADKKKKVSTIDEQILDSTKLMEEANKAKQAIMSEIHLKKNERLNREFVIKNEVLAEFREKEATKQLILNEIDSKERQLNQYHIIIESYNNDMKRMLSERENLLNEWRKIQASTLHIDEENFICPTCKRMFEVADIEAKQAEITYNFNVTKSNHLDANKQSGMAIKDRIEKLQLDINQQIGLYDKCSNEIKSLKEKSIITEVINIPDATIAIQNDKTYKDLCNKLTDLENQLEQSIEMPDITELRDGKNILNSSIADLNILLAKKDIIASNNKRISELESENKNLSQELADLEKIEFTISAFAKAKIEAIEDSINSLFSFVKFRMYDQQINGGEIETCEAMVDGVPFSDLNTAMKINAGLDIINAICKWRNTNAPIWIDNAESVNSLIHTDSQIIRLVVTMDLSLQFA